MVNENINYFRWHPCFKSGRAIGDFHRVSWEGYGCMCVNASPKVNHVLTTRELPKEPVSFRLTIDVETEVVELTPNGADAVVLVPQLVGHLLPAGAVERLLQPHPTVFLHIRRHFEHAAILLTQYVEILPVRHGSASDPHSALAQNQ